MKMGKVDVIIPIYNSLDWLKICIEGVLKNTKQSVLGKIYLINDCSKEETTNYLNNLDTYNGLIEVIHNKKNLGFVKTCNYGMKISKSDYVLLLNTDCKSPLSLMKKPLMPSLVKYAFPFLHSLLKQSSFDSHSPPGYAFL